MDNRPRDVTRSLDEPVATNVPNLADDDPITITVTPAPWYALLENNGAPPAGMGPLLGQYSPYTQTSQQSVPRAVQRAPPETLPMPIPTEPIRINLHLRMDENGNLVQAGSERKAPVAATLSSPAAPKGPPKDRCQGCGTEIISKFCHMCGKRRS